jgi:taurine dioxygenase/pentalenolactone F synthase
MLRVTPIEGTLGAEVSGWEPARDLGGDELTALLGALESRLVLVFRGHPHPTDQQIVGLASRFGQVFAGGDSYGVAMAHPQVLQVSNELGADGYEVGVAGSGQLPWHTDYSFLPRPAQETVLEALLLPPSGGPATYFCDMYSAWATLPEDTRHRLGGLVATHLAMASASYLQPAGGGADPDADARAAQRNPRVRLPGDGGPAIHPLVVRHPRTGRTALYVSEFVDEIDGMDHDEAHRLVVELVAHATRPERVYRHEWQPGDLIIFDTIGTVHRRDLSRHDESRTMRQLSTVVPAGLGV